MDPGVDLGPYDLRLAQASLRKAIPEDLTMRLSYTDIAAHEALFRRAVDYMRSHVELIRLLPSGPPTFVLNYMPPQQNPLGRLLPRYDLRNPVHFIEELNRALYDIVAAIPYSHVLDIAQIGACVGRQRFQDDPFFLTAHGGFVADYDFQFDKERLEPQQPLSSRFDFATQLTIESFWNEAQAMYRTLRGVDRVKVLCVDLDDTLWRGVPAELEDVDPAAMEGWPLGLAEALTVLRQRGVVLAIISKNDEARVREMWPQLFSGKLMLEDFAIRKIGWRPKPEAMAEVIAEANVLPESVVFLDDNPVERALMKSVHPLVRVIEAPHIDWRRILLWSPEMQVDVITEESTSRNVMIQAQVQRESDRLKMGLEEFLRSLDLRVELNRIDRAEGPQFQRALELVNKTNQFNTTGRRWTAGDTTDFLSSGGGGNL
jgi:FkbH-like protein